MSEEHIFYLVNKGMNFALIFAFAYIFRDKINNFDLKDLLAFRSYDIPKLEQSKLAD